MAMPHIGVISDTHGLLRPQAVAALRGSSLIIHAGDVGVPEILDELRRIAPVFAAASRDEIARQFNLEFRACDAAASPYLALGAVMFAGADGIRRSLPLPAGAAAASLPQTLDTALDHFEASEAVARWFGALHRDAYLRFKRVEAEKVAGLLPAELCAHYADIY